MVCLGKYVFQPGTRIWVMHGVNHATRFQDVASIALVASEVMECSLPTN